MSQKIVINPVYGGFSINKAIHSKMVELGYKAEYNLFPKISRDNKFLVEALQDILSRTDGVLYNDLGVAEIPDNVEWVIEEYDGREWISEKHRMWGINGEFDEQ